MQQTLFPQDAGFCSSTLFSNGWLAGPLKFWIPANGGGGCLGLALLGKHFPWLETMAKSALRPTQAKRVVGASKAGMVAAATSTHHQQPMSLLFASSARVCDDGGWLPEMMTMRTRCAVPSAHVAGSLRWARLFESTGTSTDRFQAAASIQQQ